MYHMALHITSFDWYITIRTCSISFLCKGVLQYLYEQRSKALYDSRRMRCTDGRRLHDRYALAQAQVGSGRHPRGDASREVLADTRISTHDGTPPLRP